MNARVRLGAVSVDAAAPSTLIRVEGEVDFSTAPELRAAIARAVGDGRRDLTVDLSAVSFMDCAGVNALLWCREHVGLAEGRLRLVRLSPSAERIITLTGLDEELAGSTES